MPVDSRPAEGPAEQLQTLTGISSCARYAACLSALSDTEYVIVMDRGSSGDSGLICRTRSVSTSSGKMSCLQARPPGQSCVSMLLTCASPCLRLNNIAGRPVRVLGMGGSAATPQCSTKPAHSFVAQPKYHTGRQPCSSRQKQDAQLSAITSATWFPASCSPPDDRSCAFY